VLEFPLGSKWQSSWRRRKTFRAIPDDAVEYRRGVRTIAILAQAIFHWKSHIQHAKTTGHPHHGSKQHLNEFSMEEIDGILQHHRH